MKKIGMLLFTSAVFAFGVPIVTAEFSDTGAAYAKSDKAGGGGNGGGSRGKSSSARGGQSERGAASAASHKSARAALGPLNSLGRNINGIMNSSDPKMASVKEYVSAVEAFGDAEAALSDAQKAYAESYADLAEAAGALNLSDTPSGWADEITALSADLAANPVAEGEEGYDAYLAELAAVQDAEAALAQALSDKGTLDAAELGMVEAEAGVSDEALTEAIVAAYNATGQTMTEADVTPEMLAFARSKLDS